MNGFLPRGCCGGNRIARSIAAPAASRRLTTGPLEINTAVCHTRCVADDVVTCRVGSSINRPLRHLVASSGGSCVSPSRLSSRQARSYVHIRARSCPSTRQPEASAVWIHPCFEPDPLPLRACWSTQPHHQWIERALPRSPSLALVLGRPCCRGHHRNVFVLGRRFFCLHTRDGSVTQAVFVSSTFSHLQKGARYASQTYSPVHKIGPFFKLPPESDR